MYYFVLKLKQALKNQKETSKNFGINVGYQYTLVNNLKTNKSMTTLTKRENREWQLPSLISNLMDSDRLFNMDFPFSDIGKNMPAVNIKENNKTFIIEMAVPGMKKEDFHVNIENNVLTVSAEKETTEEKTSENYARKEYNFNSFSCSFTLPDYVKHENLEGKYDNGVLKITIPKKEEAINKAPMEIKIS